MKNENRLGSRLVKVIVLLFMTLICGQFSDSLVYAQNPSSDLPERKQTTLGLYVTSAEAFEMWSADKDHVVILDIRTPEEYLFVGHPAMAWNVPAFDQSYEWDAKQKHFPMVPNPDFVKTIKKLFQTDDTLLITCRSGDRSALAVNELAKAGYTRAYTITDGFEGGIVTDPESVFSGQHMLNGWKNSGLPYTYDLDPELMPYVNID